VWGHAAHQPTLEHAFTSLAEDAALVPEALLDEVVVVVCRGRHDVATLDVPRRLLPCGPCLRMLDQQEIARVGQSAGEQFERPRHLQQHA
jgi:hypothetical protein